MKCVEFKLNKRQIEKYKKKKNTRTTTTDCCVNLVEKQNKKKINFAKCKKFNKC